jgi:hypothetical protein
MNASKTCATKIRSTAGKILLALAFASMIGGVSAGPAFSDDNGWHRGHQNRRWNERDRRDGRYRYDNRNRRAYVPLYAPPPVVYAPVPSPGVSIFFPWFR